MNTFGDICSGSAVKNPPVSVRDMSSIPGSGRSLGEGNGNPLQYSCLWDFMGSQRAGHDLMTEQLAGIIPIKQSCGEASP